MKSKFIAIPIIHIRNTLNAYTLICWIFFICIETNVLVTFDSLGCVVIQSKARFWKFSLNKTYFKNGIYWLSFPDLRCWLIIPKGKIPRTCTLAYGSRKALHMRLVVQSYSAARIGELNFSAFFNSCMVSYVWFEFAEFLYPMSKHDKHLVYLLYTYIITMTS